MTLLGQRHAARQRRLDDVALIVLQFLAGRMIAQPAEFGNSSARIGASGTCAAPLRAGRSAACQVEGGKLSPAAFNQEGDQGRRGWIRP
jgi:hypothetical protein